MYVCAVHMHIADYRVIDRLQLTELQRENTQLGVTVALVITTKETRVAS